MRSRPPEFDLGLDPKCLSSRVKKTVRMNWLSEQTAIDTENSVGKPQNAPRRTPPTQRHKAGVMP